jgi:hypothetical protein
VSAIFVDSRCPFDSQAEPLNRDILCVNPIGVLHLDRDRAGVAPICKEYDIMTTRI